MGHGRGCRRGDCAGPVPARCAGRAWPGVDTPVCRRCGIFSKGGRGAPGGMGEGDASHRAAGSGAARGRPLRARITRPPPPKLLGEVGAGQAVSVWRKTSNCVRRGAPPPAPPRSFLTERGEFDPVSTATHCRLTHKRQRGRYLPPAPHPPVREGGLRVVVAANSFAIAAPTREVAARHVARRKTSNCVRRGAPPPAPSPLVPHGEGRIRSRVDGHSLPSYSQPATWQVLASAPHPPVREGGLRVVVAANSFAIAAGPRRCRCWGIWTKSSSTHGAKRQLLLNYGVYVKKRENRKPHAMQSDPEVKSPGHCRHSQGNECDSPS